MLYSMLGSTWFYYRTLIFIQFVLFLVIILHLFNTGLWKKKFYIYFVLNFLNYFYNMYHKLSTVTVNTIFTLESNLSTQFSKTRFWGLSTNKNGKIFNEIVNVCLFFKGCNCISLLLPKYLWSIIKCP